MSPGCRTGPMPRRYKGASARPDPRAPALPPAAPASRRAILARPQQSRLADDIATAGRPEIAPVERGGAIGHQQEHRPMAKRDAARPPRHRTARAIPDPALGDPAAVDEYLLPQRENGVAGLGRDALYQRY